MVQRHRQVLVEVFSKSAWVKAGRLAVVLLLIGAAFSAGGIDLLASHVEDHCGEYCDEECRSCGDCVQCRPTIHVISAPASSDLPSEDSLAWSIDLADPRLEGTYASGIDHPPQNLC